jgi:hypothetical protein
LWNVFDNADVIGPERSRSGNMACKNGRGRTASWADGFGAPRLVAVAPHLPEPTPPSFPGLNRRFGILPASRSRLYLDRLHSKRLPDWGVSASTLT